MNIGVVLQELKPDEFDELCDQVFDLDGVKSFRAENVSVVNGITQVQVELLPSKERILVRL